MNVRQSSNLTILEINLVADDDQIRDETCTDPCGLNRSDEAASTAADDDQIRVETCTDPCGLNRSDEAASTAADDDQISIFVYLLKTSIFFVFRGYKEASAA